jgi:hypothetical protein
MPESELVTCLLARLPAQDFDFAVVATGMYSTKPFMPQLVGR